MGVAFPTREMKKGVEPWLLAGGWLAGRLAGWLASWLAAWLAGWLVPPKSKIFSRKVEKV